MHRNARRTLAAALALALAAGTITAPASADAAKKPKLSKTSLTLKAGKSAKVKIRNVKAKKVKKLTVKTSAKKTAVVKKNGKTAFTVTAKRERDHHGGREGRKKDNKPETPCKGGRSDSPGKDTGTGRDRAGNPGSPSRDRTGREHGSTGHGAAGTGNPGSPDGDAAHRLLRGLRERPERLVRKGERGGERRAGDDQARTLR